MKPSRLACATVLAFLPAAGRADTQPSPSPTEKIVVTARRLTKARNEIETRIGATVTTLTRQNIEQQPGGVELSLNQTLLQVPGISQDSFGQIHLRNDHANIQYRIDGIILPEGISFFGQSLTSRFASSIDVITGSLPAQYGLVTTGIVDIQTREGAFEPGGSVGFYGGSHDWLEPSGEYAGHTGSVNYYVAGDYLHNGLGIENPTRSSSPLHDDTNQYHLFGYAEDILDDTSKISALAGAYRGTFQIPNTPGQMPLFTVDGINNFNSAALGEHQTENNDYAAVAYLKAAERYSVQVSAFVRGSTLHYTPDRFGDLAFYGLSQNADRADLSEGVQVDGSLNIAADHTLRFGGLFTAERATSSTNSLVFGCPVADCSVTGTSPLPVHSGSGETGYTYSLYVQDEWRILPALTLNYGVRYDVLNAYTDTQQLSPRINLVYKPDARSTLHAGYARYFTPPSLELISGQNIASFDGTTGYPGGYTPAAPPLDGPILPERSNYFDVGADREFLPGLKLGIDGYYKIARDLIDEGQFGAPIILSVFNYAHANVLGLEVSSGYSRGNFSSYANFSVGREKARQVASQQFNFGPDDLDYIAHHYIYTDHSQLYTASAGASYVLFGAHLSTDLIYGSGLREDTDTVPNGGEVAPYLQLNFGARYRFENVLGGPLEINGAIINATDRTYQIRSGSGVGVFAPQYGPRRAFYAGIRKFF